ncbi:MAG TPA: PsbP-related protein [Candidatus Saccharimonadales bacterium]|nr:PsbP-related protein [Candidatus Saccharimonadales bacterium]
MKGTPDKKIIIIICAVIVVLLGVIFFLKSSQSTQQPQKDASSDTTSTKTATTYHTNSYSLSYPHTWTKSEKQLTDDQGTVMTLLPQKENSGQFSTITIEVLNSELTTIESVSNLFEALNYAKTTTTVAGISAEKYTAVLPTQDGSLHSIAYVFQQNEKIYSLKLEYINSNTNVQLEGKFYQLVSSFLPQ